MLDLFDEQRDRTARRAHLVARIDCEPLAPNAQGLHLRLVEAFVLFGAHSVAPYIGVFVLHGVIHRSDARG